MNRLDPAAVAAANDAWVMTPEGSTIVETAEYRLARLPERFPDPLQVQWVRSTRPAETVLAELVSQARQFKLPEAYVYVKLSAPDGFDKALLARGAELVDTADVLATALPVHIAIPDNPALVVQWRISSAITRDANTVGTSIFGGSPASEDEISRATEVGADTFASGRGGAIVAYLDGTPIGVAGLDIVDGVARLWGGGVLEGYRRRGVYRAMLATRMMYAVEYGATMAFTQGRISTSSPILRQLGFISYGQERSYRLPLK